MGDLPVEKRGDEKRHDQIERNLYRCKIKGVQNGFQELLVFEYVLVIGESDEFFGRPEQIPVGEAEVYDIHQRYNDEDGGEKKRRRQTNEGDRNLPGVVPLADLLWHFSHIPKMIFIALPLFNSSKASRAFLMSNLWVISLPKRSRFA